MIKKTFYRNRLFATPMFLASLLLPCITAAQTSPTPGTPAVTPKPDFSGRWKMVKEQSNFGGFHMPDIVVRVVDDHSPTMNVHTVQTTGEKTSSADVTYFTDGSSTKNVINGRDAESKSFWDGSVLVIRTNMKDSQNENEVIEDRWQLSPDLETLTTTSHIETPKGQVDMKLVCVRQKSAG